MRLLSQRAKLSLLPGIVKEIKAKSVSLQQSSSPKIPHMEKASSTFFEFRHQALDIAYLQRLYRHEPSYAFDMFEGFLREIGARITQLGNAIAENNREQVKYYAHQLRAFTGIVGLTRVQSASERLESCSMAGSQDTIQQLFGEISTGIRLAMQPVRLELERLRAFLQSREH